MAARTFISAAVARCSRHLGADPDLSGTPRAGQGGPAGLVGGHIPRILADRQANGGPCEVDIGGGLDAPPGGVLPGRVCVEESSTGEGGAQ